jgi:hypothetical protein
VLQIPRKIKAGLLKNCIREQQENRFLCMYNSWSWKYHKACKNNNNIAITQIINKNISCTVKSIQLPLNLCYSSSPQEYFLANAGFRLLSGPGFHIQCMLLFFIKWCPGRYKAIPIIENLIVLVSTDTIHADLHFCWIFKIAEWLYAKQWRDMLMCLPLLTSA